MRKQSLKAEIGIFGGSGFYDFLLGVKEIEIKTPYGAPSAQIALGEYGGRKIAFLPRHGKNHKYPPNKIPYLANLWAFKKLGVKRIIAPCASGSLDLKVRPGDFVLCDQFVDRTKNRTDTFFEPLSPIRNDISNGKKNSPQNSRNPLRGFSFSADISNGTNGFKVAHISSANPYCGNLRKIAAESCQKLKIPYHKKGTAVVIEGPRFSTTAESLWFQNQKWQVINMTQYPECVLARELEMCYMNVSLITDYDAGLVSGKKLKPVDLKEVLRVFKENNKKVKELIFEIIKNIPCDLHCSCEEALKNAVF